MTTESAPRRTREFDQEFLRAVAEHASRRHDPEGRFEVLESSKYHDDGVIKRYVFRMADDGAIYAFEVGYDSWNGTLWEDMDSEETLDEVFPFVKTITVYE